jgi:hypothetical protein
MDWAMVENNLCNVLRVLGARESGTTHLEQAATACNEGLKEWTRQRAPIYWAMTQNNLCNVLQVLGARESGTTHLEQAATACNEALKERTRKRMPLDWAITQDNLGNVLGILGYRNKDPALLCEALEDHVGAWEVFSSGAPHYASIAINSVNKDMALLKKKFDRNKYERCLTDNREALMRMSVHQD